MNKLTEEELMDIAMAGEPGGTLDQTEQALRDSDHNDLADALVKLQQDAGLEIDPSFDPEDISNPPGEITKALWNAYEPVTRERYNALMTAIEQCAPQNEPPPAFTPEP